MSRFLLLGAERFPLVGLRGLGKHLVCFDKLYDARRTNSGDDKPRVDLAMEPLLKNEPAVTCRDAAVDGWIARLQHTSKKHGADGSHTGIWRSEILCESVRATAGVENPCVNR